MRTLLLMWLIPVGLLGTWYGLASNDINFGTIYFSRQMHDLVFNLYGKMLGIDPELLPAMLARTLAFDTLLVFAIVAYRKRAVLIPYLKQLVRQPSS